ncbi:MAG: hypothetical protein E4H43_03420, partial [Bacteroidia bacterium]
MKKTFVYLLTLFSLLMFSLGSFGSSTVHAASVEPVIVDDNPICVEQGFGYGYKIDPPTTGGYVVVPDYLSINWSSADGVYFNWSSTAGIDAVIVKGGDNANVYTYNPESKGDTGLNAPVNASGKPAAISHLEFCYDFEVVVKKNASTDFSRKYNWSINKSVTPAEWNLFNGDSGTSLYSVAVTKTGYTDSNWIVRGDIDFRNPAPTAATIVSVSDNISGFGEVAVNCPVGFPYSLAAGDTLHCTYNKALPDGSSRTNTATVITSGAVGGSSGSAQVTFVSPGSEVNASVNVDDSNGMSWLFNKSGSVSYEKTFTCNADRGKVMN